LGKTGIRKKEKIGTDKGYEFKGINGYLQAGTNKSMALLASGGSTPSQFSSEARPMLLA
jgi:hypothetical protein